MSSQGQNELRFYGQSTLMYWWPVWLVASVIAFLTWKQGIVISGPEFEMRVHPNRGLGVIFLAVLSIVVLVTNVHMRGLTSIVVILSCLLGTMLLAYYKQWEGIFRLYGVTAIYINLTFYVIFVAAHFFLWAFVVFVTDRLSFYRLKPGQLTRENLFGMGRKSWNTSNVRFEKVMDNPFRNWILGLGSGDLVITTIDNEKITIRNVPFLGSKINKMERLIAIQPGSL